MINRIVILGRIVEPPRLETPSDAPPRTVLRLEVTHPRFGSAEALDRASITVHGYGDRRAEVLRQYLEAGRDLLVEGHLDASRGGLIVVMERFSFVERGIETRYLWSEALAAERQQAA